MKNMNPFKTVLLLFVIGFLCSWQLHAQFDVTKAKVYPESCIGCMDGGIILEVNNEVGFSYNFKWSHDSFAYGGAITGLGTGEYFVTISDYEMPPNEIIRSYIVSLDSTDTCNIYPMYEMFKESGAGNSDGQVYISDIANGTMPYSYTWSSLDTGNMADSLTAGTYYVTVMDVNFCIAIDTFEIVADTGVIDTCGLYAYFSPMVMGMDFTANNMSTGTFDKFVWDFGDGFVDSVSYEPSHTYMFEGTYYVSLQIYNSNNGCSDYVSHEVIIDTSGAGDSCNLMASFMAYPMGLPNQYEFNNYTMGIYQKWLWDFGDGFYDFINTNPIHTFMTQGNFFVYLEVWDTINNCYDIMSYEVYIDSVGAGDSCNLMASFMAYPMGLPNQYEFYNYSMGYTNYLWDFGDGFYDSINTNPTHTYMSQGSFIVWLNIWDTINNCYDSMSYEVFVDSVGAGDSCSMIYASFSYIPLGDTVEFMNYSTGAMYYDWDFGDGFFSTVPNPTHVYTTPGYYDVWLYVENDMGCLDSTFMEVWIEDPSACNAYADFNFYPETEKAVYFYNYSWSYDKFIWSFGDGTVDSVTSDPIHVYMTNGTYDVKLVVFDSFKNCSDTVVYTVMAADSITQDTTCKADFSIAINKDSLFITNKSSGMQPIEYSWDFGDGFWGYEKDPVHLYTYNGYFRVWLSVSNPYGCFAEKDTVILVNTDTSYIPCLASFSYSLMGDSIVITNLSQGTNLHYYWNIANTFDYSADPAPVIASWDGYYYVYLDVYDSITGCYSYTSDEIYVDVTADSSGANCKASFNVTKLTTDKIKLESTSLGSSLEYYWDFGDYTTSSETTPTHQYYATGSYEVYLSVYDMMSGCMDWTSKVIDISDSSSTTFTNIYADFSTFINGNTVTFKDISKGTVTNRYWTFDDGSYMDTSAVSVSHTFKYPGIYNVCLNAYDKNQIGSMDYKCKEIMVGSSVCDIKANFSYIVDNAATSVTFSNKSTGSATQWYWSFGDGTTSTLKSPAKKVYTKPGWYIVSLSASDALGNCFDFMVSYIQVGTAECKADFDYLVDATTKKVTFKNTSKGTNLENFWYFDDGKYAMTKDATNTYSKSGLYFPSLTVSDPNGLCMDFAYKTIQVGKVDCSADFETMITGTSVKFKSKTVGNDMLYYWMFGTGDVSIDTNPTFDFKYAGIHWAGLYTYDFATQCLDYKEKYVIVGNNNDLEADFIHTSVGKKVKFTNKSIGSNITTYFWDFGNGIIKETNKDTISMTYANAGFVNVCLLAQNQSGIYNISCKDVLVDPTNSTDCKADFKFTVDKANRKVNFTDKSLGTITNWKWEFGDNASSTLTNVDHTYTADGLYQVKLTVSNSLCKKTTYELVSVNGGDSLMVGFGYDIDSSGTKASGYPVDFVGISHGDAAKLKWDFGDGSTSTTTESPTHVYKDAGTYTACLEVWDEITGEYDKKCQTVTVGETADTNQQQSIPDIIVLPGELSMNIFPNPVENDLTTITYSLTQKSDVVITIIDITGSQEEIILNSQKQAGVHTLVYYTKSLTSGVYFVRFSTNNSTITKKIIIK